MAFARAGAHVVVNFLKQEAGARSLEREILSLGLCCVCVQADVRKQDEVLRLVAEGERSFGHVDVLVNNAGIIRPQAISDITEQDWDALMTANLKSCFLMTQAVLPGMRERQYAAANAGVHGMTHYYARHLAKDGITVNVIAPALIATEMVRSNPNAKADLIPVGRFGECEEVADVAVMLANNGYVTGQTINVNGGWYM